MTIYYNARMRYADIDPYLKDRRALILDGVGISVNELIRMETDKYFVPHPLKCANLVTYYKDIYLANEICSTCEINKYNSFVENQVEHSSLYDQNKIKRERINHLLKKTDSIHTYLYFARLRAAIKNIKFANREEVSRLTGISVKSLSKIERNKCYVPHFELLVRLLEQYRCVLFKEDICRNCPVKQAEIKIKEENKNEV